MAALFTLDSWSWWQGWKKPGFKERKTAQWVFLVFKKSICPEERDFRVFSVSRILLGASRL
jgi:hypothetical protein